MGFLGPLRKRAMDAFLKQGLPGRKSEEYKYSNPEKLFRGASIKPESLGLESVNFNVSGLEKKPSVLDLKKLDKALQAFEIKGVSENRVVLVNGVYIQELSALPDMPEGVLICSLAGALTDYRSLLEKHFSKYADVEADPFIALNTAYAGDGLFMRVAEGVTVGKTIHILNVITDEASALLNKRNLILLERSAEVDVVESTVVVSEEVNVGRNVVNELSELILDEQSRLRFYRMQQDCEGLNLISTVQVLQKASSHFDTHTITLSGDWMRNNLNIVVDAERCETHLNGLYITRGIQHVDNHTLVDQRKPNCESNQLYKGILADKSTGVFNGKIFVRRDAQKINAYQSSKTILLSDDATVNTKPQLEIYANDVKCSHGSSTGHLDEEAMFYLRSRGLSEESAKRMLLYAFASDVVDTIRIEPLRAYANDLISKQLDFDIKK